MGKNQNNGESDTGIKVLFEPPTISGSRMGSSPSHDQDLTMIGQDFVNRVYDLLDASSPVLTGYCSLDVTPKHSVEVIVLQLTDLVSIEVVMRVNRP